MKTKTRLLTTTAAIALLASSLAWAGTYYPARGRVLAVEPIYEMVEVNRPERRCWDEQVQVRHPGDTAVPTVAGAIVGGVVGNQFGHGSGKDAATVAGALLGGAVGNQMAQSQPSYRVERRCEQVNQVESHREVVAYRVKYEYNGEILWTRTKHRPGKYIDLDVNVQPVR